MVDLLVDEVCSPFFSLSLVKEGEMFKKQQSRKKDTYKKLGTTEDKVAILVTFLKL